MKKIISVWLAVFIACTTLGTTAMATTVKTGGKSDATTTPAPMTTLGFSAQDTIPAAGTVTNTAKDTMAVGETFTVTFSKEAIKWSGKGTGYGIGKLDRNTWLRISDTGFTCTDAQVDALTGNVILTLKSPAAAWTGDLRVALNGGAGETNAMQKRITITDTVAAITGTKSGGSAPTTSAGSFSITTGEQITWRVPANNFNWSSAGTKNAASLTDTSWIRLDGAKAGTDFKVSYTTPANSEEVYVTLTALKSGTWNSLRVYLQNGAATTRSAAVKVTVSNSGNGKINGISDSAQIGGTWSGALLNDSAISLGDLYALEVKPKDELLIPFSAGFFTWNGTAPYEDSAVTTSQLSNGSVKVGMTNRKGSAAFNGKAELVSKNGRAYIKVKFADNYTNVKDLDFSATIYLTVSGKRHTDSQLELSGSLVREVYEVGGEDYIDISDGQVVEPTEYMRNVELYLGEGVSVFANLFKGKKYSGTAEYSYNSSDEDLMAKYPSIEHVIKLTTYNLSASSNKVSFDLDGSYYVYNEHYEYVGRSNQKVPFSNKYYLSSKDISIKDSSGGDRLPAEEVPPRPSEVTNPPTNQNDNPYTGW